MLALSACAPRQVIGRVEGMNRSLLCGFGILAVGLASVTAEFREWTATDGRTLLAELVGVDDGKVTVKRRNDGRQFTLELDKLSEADQKWVEENRDKVGLGTSTTAKEVDPASPLARLITGDWERHESEGLKFRIFGERKLLNASAGLNDSPTKFPLVIYLHGKSGDVMTSAKPWSADTFADKKNYRDRPCFILAPQAPKEDETWSGRNGDAVIKIAQEMLNELPIDERRIYLTGYSMGAYGTFHLLAEEPKLFAAAVPIAGGGNPSAARTYKKVPIWVFHGAKDPTVDVSQSQKMVDALKKARAVVEYTEYPDGDHGIAGQVYGDEKVHEWLFQQVQK